MSKQRPVGLTVIELMVTITVIMLVIITGLPSYQTFQKNNAATAMTDTLAASLRVARVEAANRGIPVVVCATDSAFNSCSAQTAWTHWVVFVDLNDDQSLDSGELLYTYAAEGSEGLSAASGFVIYEPTGFARTTNNFTIQPNGCTRGKALNILLNGSFSTTTTNCP